MANEQHQNTITFLDPVAGASPVAPPEGHSSTHRNHCIFIIEDSELFRYYLKAFLRNHLERVSAGVAEPKHYNIYLFSNGADALAELWRNPDLIILDYYLDADVDGMPRNGDWVYTQLRENGCMAKVVVLSQATDPEVMVELVKLGVRDYLIKDLNHMQELGRYLEF